MASKTKAKKATMPPQRRKTDASQAFDQKQIQEFKEAFTILDQNKDGFIDKSDLRDVYAMMGQIPNDSNIDEMMKECSGPLSFPAFLTMFGERLTGTDPDETVAGAFQLFDHLGTGFMPEELLLRTLKNPRGEPFKEDEIKAMYKGNPPIANGQVDVNAFVKLITTGGADELSKVNA